MNRPPGLPDRDARTPESRERAEFLMRTVDEHLWANKPSFTGLWVPVEAGYPNIGKINGFWDTVPVIVALDDGRVCGAFFSYVGGDAMDTDDDGNPEPARTPVPSFETDEGCAYNKVLFWALCPEHPTIHYKRPTTYA
jgi:hypothetical protein